MGRFSATVGNFVDSALLAQTQGFRKIALDTLNKVQKKTPVDSGALRRSWTVALNAVPRLRWQPNRHCSGSVVRYDSDCDG
ncbi:putative bacteriophage protein [Haemophilus parahaemolyticus HK385]|uniref:Uncharacterized protein n=1 Tax=Haemophilus parahaemolyticus HK385 TaxID=1095744 RepID=A0ABN0F1Z8_HAEPH|nr:HK97 gp10 family phage protein [Haemophilus parahaemolyticus]EIJ72939.1 hypothetical protein HMPREF1050_0016 [Haemophilus parahaemolyticus HK385]STO66235.1 putative bacteriophage protein [Haemophilus parahaemolyticus HK385]DAS15783.1 MAG TPA: putative tail component [Caudoviricetes sp.]